MGCPDENTLVAFASGSLSMADASLVDEHLDTCPTCFALVAELARTAPEEAEPTRLVPIQTEEPAPTPAPPPDKPAAEPPPPSQLGRHTLLHRIGADAVGVIYVAHDRELDRRVALKLIGTSRDPGDADERARIIREARALARLRHPNVVEVHDGGEIDDRLYVSMALVDGEPLDRWLLRPGKSWLDRLAMFLQAGRGLAAAHALGIVHRDFRPANAIVDLEGRVRVTDFGFARATAALQDDAPTVVRATPVDPSSLHSLHHPVTRSGFVLGTPAYMAPEQFEGRGDARIDQYAFCVALYEALYRRRPFEANDPQTLRAQVLAGAVPSIPTTSEVPGWLGAIVVRGLHRDPDRRFPDMPTLLAAIEGGLERRRKRRIGVLVGTGAVAAIVLGTGIAAAVGRDPCPRAEERLRDVWDAPRREAAATAMRGSGLSYADQAWTRTARRLDARALAWAQLHEAACAEARDRDRAEAGDDPRRRCLDRRLVELRAVTQMLGESDVRVVERAHALVDEWPDVQSCGEAIAEDDAEALELQPTVAMARALVLAGRLDEAAPSIDRIVHGARGRALQAEGTRLLGALELARGRPGAAADAVVRAMTAAVASGDPDALAESALMHGRACLELGRIEQGLQSIALGRAALERLGPRPRLEAELLVVEGALQGAAGRYPAARTVLQRALEVADDDLVRAAAFERFGLVALASGDAIVAEQSLARALGLRETELGGQHPEVARTLDALADAAALAGRDADALQLASRALSIRESSLDPKDVRLADALDRVGRSATRVGRREDALAVHRRALALRQQALGEADPAVIRSHIEVGRAQAGLGHPREAQSELRRAVELGTRALGGEHVDVVAARDELARVHQLERAWGPAIVEIEQVLAIRRKTLGERSPQVAVALVRLAELRRGEGRRDLARSTAQQALQWLAPADDPDAFVRAQLLLAELAWHDGDESRARVAAQAAVMGLQPIGAKGQRALADATAWLEAHRPRDGDDPVVVDEPGAPAG